MSTEHYWPGPFTWEEIVAIVRALPDRIEPEHIGTVATIAGMLAVFGFPEGSTSKPINTTMPENAHPSKSVRT